MGKNSFSMFYEKARKNIEKEENEFKHTFRHVDIQINNIKKMKKDNPDWTEEDIEKEIEKNINNCIGMTYRESLLINRYISSMCLQFLKNNKTKYDEIQEKLKCSTKDYEELDYKKCENFDEFLELTIYNVQKAILYDYLDETDITPEKCKNLDDLLENDKQMNTVFSESRIRLTSSIAPLKNIIFSKDISQAKKQKMINYYLSMMPDARYKKVFEYMIEFWKKGTYGVMEQYSKETLSKLKKDLAQSTEDIVRKLDELGFLENYLVSHIIQMCENDFPEYIGSFIDRSRIADINKFGEEIKKLEFKEQASQIRKVIKKEELLRLTSKGYLNNSPIEQLFAINGFWVNRFSKELDSYAKAIFLMKNTGIIKQIVNSDNNLLKIREVPREDIEEILRKLGIFYYPVGDYLKTKKENILEPKNEEENSQKIDNTDSTKSVYEYRINTNNICDEMVVNMRQEVLDEYEEHFAETLPWVRSNLEEDAKLALKLQMPMHFCYDLKKDVILSILLNSELFPKTFCNVGIIKNETDIENRTLIGIDAETSFPIRLHIENDVLKEFLCQIKQYPVIQKYQGGNDFNKSMMNTYIETPISDKMRKALVAKTKELERNPSLNPNARNGICHLGINKKYTPEHLKTSYIEKGKKKSEFIARYVDLDTGDLFTEFEGGYIPIEYDERMQNLIQNDDDGR